MQNPSPRTYTQSNPETLYILFADLKEYSANKENLDLIGQMEDALYDIGAEYFDASKGHCFKVLGDGMVATDTDPEVLALKALLSVDYIQERFAQADEFKSTPQIRIALHVAQVGELRERHMSFPIGPDHTFDLFKDIAGSPVINAARIEPIVKPDFVFCSEAFKQALGSSSAVQTQVLGTYALGKKHDTFEVELHVVHPEAENPDLENLRTHIDDKLSDRQETYTNVSNIIQQYHQERKDIFKSRTKKLLSKLPKPLIPFHQEN